MAAAFRMAFRMRLLGHMRWQLSVIRVKFALLSQKKMNVLQRNLRALMQCHKIFKNQRIVFSRRKEVSDVTEHFIVGAVFEFSPVSKMFEIRT